MAKTYRTFAEFWPFYLREHALGGTRWLHFAGTSLLFVVLAAALLLRRPMLLFALPITGYGFAWFAHFFVEHNRPATFTYPLWSLAADFKMWGLMLAGRLGPHLARARQSEARARQTRAA